MRERLTDVEEAGLYPSDGRLKECLTDMFDDFDTDVINGVWPPETDRSVFEDVLVEVYRRYIMYYHPEASL